MSNKSLPHNPGTAGLLLLFAALNVFRIVSRQNSPMMPIFIVALVLMVIMLVIHVSVPYAVFNKNGVLITNNYFGKKEIVWSQITNIDRIGNKISVLQQGSSKYTTINLRQMSKKDRATFLEIFNKMSSSQTPLADSASEIV